MNIFYIKLDEWNTILISINWIALIVLIVLISFIAFLTKKAVKYARKKRMIIEEITLGIGNNSLKLTYNEKDREIAYKIWVELTTRKVGVDFEEENDVIVEVYNSWYNFFKTVRELMKDVPSAQITNSQNLISLTEQVLNKGLRPHLTKWQAKFRKWYENESKKEENSDCTPQELQRKYPEYTALVKDLLETNKRIIAYKLLLQKIAFKE